MKRRRGGKKGGKEGRTVLLVEVERVLQHDDVFSRERLVRQQLQGQVWGQLGAQGFHDLTKRDGQNGFQKRREEKIKTLSLREDQLTLARPAK